MPISPARTLGPKCACEPRAHSPTEGSCPNRRAARAIWLERGLAAWRRRREAPSAARLRIQKCAAAAICSEGGLSGLARSSTACGLLFDEAQKRRKGKSLLSDGPLRRGRGFGVRIFIGSEKTRLFSLSGFVVIGRGHGATARDKVVGARRHPSARTRLNYARIVPMVRLTPRSCVASMVRK